MKRKTNRLLSFIFALVLMAELLPISIFATGNNYTDDDLSEALEAYKKFTEGEYHEDEWTYTIESFGLYDLNHDGIPELFTLGGFGRNGFFNIFTYKNGVVSHVQSAATFEIYDNGLISLCWTVSSAREVSQCYYTVNNDLSFDLVYNYTEFSSAEETTYFTGTPFERIPYAQIEEALAGILGDAKPVEIEFHGNNAAERSAVFSSGAAEVKNYFEDYLRVLEENRNGILTYNWQNYGSEKRESAPIAFVDILGDETSELLFIAADSHYDVAKLYIYTYKNGSAYQVFSTGIDVHAGGWHAYCVFQAGEQKDFWIHQYSANEESVINHIRYAFDKNLGVLSPAEKYECRSAPDYEHHTSIVSWKHNESEITESEYTVAITKLGESTSNCILRNTMLDNAISKGYISAYSHESISMTYDEAIAYLSANRDISIPFNGYTARFSNSFFAEPSWKSNRDLALLSGVLSWAVYHDEDKPTIKEVYSKLGIPEEDIFDNSHERDEKDLRFSIAKKTLYIDGEKTNLLIIVAQGTTNMSEAWRDRWTTANERFLGVPAYGLIYEFQEDIREELVNFCNEHKDLETLPLKVLVTGHSLGGAAANLVAANFTYYADSGSWWSEVADKDDIFCYTFGAIDSIYTFGLGTVSNGFENIHNIYNIYDSFGPFGHLIVTANGNSMYGKFGHMDLFMDSRPDGSVIDTHRHRMYTYLDAVIAGDSAENRIFYENPALQKIVEIHCPVDVAVYRGSELVGQIMNNEVVESVTQIPMSVIEDSKYVLLPDDAEYRFEITATDSGTMTFSCKDAATGNDAKTFTDVALEAGKTMTGTVGGAIETLDVKLYVVNDEGAPIAEVQEDGTEAPIEQIAAVNATTEVLEDSTEAAVKQNGKFVILLMGIGSIVLIGLVVLFLLKRRNRNKKGL